MSAHRTYSRIASSSALALLEHLRDGKARSRSRLAELSGVARSTAGIKVDELIRASLVKEEEASYTGGRPSSKVRLIPRARIVLAADVGATHAKLAITDLLGAIIAERSCSISPDYEPESILEWLLEQTKQICSDEQLSEELLAAIGIGIAAPIEYETGRPVNPPIMPKWRNFDVREWFQSRVSVPVIVDKDVNMMAVGELVANPGHKNLLFAKVSTGIGLGIINRGLLHRGEQGLAGDIGHVRVDRRKDVPCRCGNSGCLEAVASGPSLASALTELGFQANSSYDVVDLVREGNLHAIQLVRQAGRDLGEVLAMCVSLLNPSTIILGGTISDAGEHLLAGVREGVYARSMPLATQKLSITHSDPLASSAIRGASALAINELFNA